MSNIIDIKDFYNHESRLTIVENAIISIDKRFDKIDKKFEKIDQQIDELTKEIRRAELSLRYEINSQFKWLVGLIVISILIPIALHALKLI